MDHSPNSSHNLRQEIRTQLEDTRQAFHSLLEQAGERYWFVPSGIPQWTVGEVLVHIAATLTFIPPEAEAIRRGVQLPKPPAALFDWANQRATRAYTRRFNARKLGQHYDRAHERLLAALEQVGDEEWQRSAAYPDVDPPWIAGQVTLADLFRYPANHFQTHAADVRAALERKAHALPDPRPANYEEGALDRLIQYPSGGWREVMFKGPRVLWRLGLGPLVGGYTLLLTHTGRKSGKLRRTMLEYHSLGGKKYIVSAFGERSQWYQNLLANPSVTVQSATGVESAVATPVTDDAEILAVYERYRRRDAPLTAWYLESHGVQPDLGDILAKKDRLHWVRLEPTPPPPVLPPQPADLGWVWLIPLAGLALWWLGRRLRKQS